MLNQKFVIKLALLTLVVTIAAFLIHYEKLSNTIRNVKEDLVFPTLTSQIEAIKRIKIVSATGSKTTSFTVIPDGKHWKISEKGGYPARDSAIRETLLGLTELVYLERKTKDPNRHKKLSLRDLKIEGSKATQIILENNDGKIVVDAYFGKRVQNLSGGTPSVYFRQTNDPQTWLVRGELEVRGEILDWLSVVLLSIQRERILKATFNSPSEPTLVLSYNKDMERFDIQGLSKKREVRSRYRVLNVGTIPENLTLQDVRPAKLTPAPNLRSVEWETNDGLVVTLQLAKGKGADDRVWAHIAAEAIDHAKDKVIKEAQQINSRTKGWEFWLGNDVIKKLNETSESLTKEKSAD